MSTTLITVLGKGRDNTQTGYREATYQFDRGEQHKTPYFGLALAQHLNPDTLIMLGTSGSMWGVLVENHAIDGEDEELRLELIEAATEARVTQDLLDRLTPLLKRILGRTFIPRIIPAGNDESEQIEILDVIATAIGKTQNDLHFDLTHGYRHLGMIGFLSSFMLERLRRKIHVLGLWYGALDMTQNEITPVLRLDGLNAVQKWVSALDKFDANGDYGIFAPLLEADGFPKNMSQNLRRAAFSQRTTNIFDAARHLQNVLIALDTPLTGASALFRETLKKRLRWANTGSLGEQQRLLAIQELERGDLLRTAILGLEAFISRLCLENNVNPLDYKMREEIDKKFQEEIKQNRQHDWKSKAYWNLKNLRNAMAHGTQSSHQETRELLKNDVRLAKELQSILSKLSTEH